MPKRSPTKRNSSKRATHTASRSPTSQKPEGPQRLQRILASAGFGSRRNCEELIEAGRIMVDGKIVTKLGTTADPKTADIRVDDNSIRPAKLIYYAVHKPTGVVTSNRDPQGRARIIDLVPPTERVFPVGRLDRNSEGLILLTNDGDLAQRLAHPKFGIRKVYRVSVAGRVTGETMKQMREGIYIAEGMVRVDGAKILKAKTKVTEMEITLREGKNREIRRILARLGHKVQTLRRIAIGPLKLGDLPLGAYRKLKREEVLKLEQASAEAAAAPQDLRSPAEKKSAKKEGGKRRPSGGPKGFKKGAKKQTRTGKVPAKGTAKRSRRAPSPIDQPIGRTGAVIGGDPVSPTPERPRRSPAKKSATKSASKKTSFKKSRGNVKRTGASFGDSSKRNSSSKNRKRRG